MPTRSLTRVDINTVQSQLLTTAANAVLASDDTAVFDASRYNRAKFGIVTAGFTSGNITATAQASVDGTNWYTIGTAATISANGTTVIGGANGTPLDISCDRFIRVIRGGDANGGTLTVSLLVANSNLPY